jgi:hypothetical protein
LEHLKQIRFVPGCRNSTLVIIPESNLGFEAMHFGDYLREEFGPERPGNYVIMKEDDARDGVKTNENIKLAMTTSFDRMLRHHAVRYHQHFFSIGDLIALDDADARSAAAQTQALTFDQLRSVQASEVMRDTLNAQLAAWMRIVQPRKDPTDDRPPRVFHTGKRGYQVDDNTICLLQSNMFAKRFHSSDVYREYHRQIAT